MLKKLVLSVVAILSPAFAFAASKDCNASELLARDTAIEKVSDDSTLYFSDAVSEVSSYRPGHWSHRSHASHASHASHRSGYRY